MTLRRSVILRLATVVFLMVVLLTAGVSIFVLASYRTEMTALERTRLSIVARDLDQLVGWKDRVEVSDLLRLIVLRNRFWRYAFVLRGETCLASTVPGNPPPELVTGSHRGGSGFTFRDRRGEVITDMAAPIPHTTAVLHVGLDRAAIDRSARPLLVRVWLVGLCGLVLGWMLVAWIAQRASREVRTLTASLRAALEDPEPGLKTARTSTGEVAELVELFDQQMEQRRRAVADLERNKRLLDDIVEAVTQPFYVINAADYTIQLANSAAWEHGIGGGTRCYEVTHGRTAPCEGDDHPCPLEIVRSTGQPAIVEHEHVAPDGRRQMVEIHGYPILDAQGNVAQMIGYTIDITERKEAEYALKESRARYERLYSMARLMADNLPDLIWAKDLEGRYLFANRALCERLLMAADTEEPVGKTDMFFASRERASHPDDPDWHTFGELCMDSDTVVVERGQPGFFHEFGNVQGQLLRLMVHKAPLFDEDGRMIGTVGSARDITEEFALQEERRLLQVTIDQAEMGVCIIDLEGTVVYANPAFLKITDFESGELIGHHVSLLVDRYANPEVAGEVAAALLEKSEWRGQAEQVRKDGTAYILGQTIMPVYGEDGRTTHMVAYVRDVTSVVKLQKQFLQSQKLETVGRLASGIAHDFNNLLGAIHAYAELLQYRLDSNPDAAADVGEILAATESGARLTRQLLAFARNEPAAPRPLDLNRVISGLEGMIGQLTGENIELVLRLGNDLPPVLSDSAQLEQLVANLVVNARDAMPEGGHLMIETRRAEHLPPSLSSSQRGPWVVLAVSDTGTGMSDEVREHIFEPFFTTKEVGKGTGLGLATCYGIVTQSGGHIDVESKLGEGTTFTIYLPASENGPDPEKPQELPQEIPGGTETVLLVEDRAALRRAIATGLRKLGYTVLEAAHGAQALALWSERSIPVDLLLTDEVMPGMPGSELARRLREFDPSLRVILVSGYVGPAMSQSQSSWIDATMRKPFSLRALAHAIRDVLDRGFRGEELS